MATTEPTKTATGMLEGRLSGPLIRPADASYDEARRVWNGMIDRHPALIARCATADDVAAVVRFAAEEDLVLAVRGGGHNVAGLGSCDGGIVADLSDMAEVHVDPGKRVAEVGGGATWGVVDAATQAHELATTGGLVSSTGIGGLTLGGGIGWLMRSAGLTCDNLIGADLVTAQGKPVHVSEEDDPELLWGLRGGGGNFGAVTSFTYRLHPLPTTVLAGMALYPIDKASEVLGFWAEWVGSLPDQLGTMVAFLSAPPEPFVPDEHKGAPVIAVLACHGGRPEDGEPLVAPLRDLGTPIVDLIGPMPYVALQSMLDPPAGLRNYWKSGYFTAATDLARAQAALIDAAATRPSPLSQIHVSHLGGAVARVAKDAKAFSQRDKAFALNVVGMWESPEDDEANLSWARWHHSALDAFITGAYVNFAADVGAEEVRSAYEPAIYERLAKLKARVDPTNLFRVNHNVIPAT